MEKVPLSLTEWQELNNENKFHLTFIINLNSPKSLVVDFKLFDISYVMTCCLIFNDLNGLPDCALDRPLDLRVEEAVQQGQHDPLQYKHSRI